jgi:hypothetical protein
MNAEPHSRRTILFVMIGCAMVGAASCVIAGFRWGYPGVVLAMVSVWTLETLVVVVSYQLCRTSSDATAPERTFGRSSAGHHEPHPGHERSIRA